MRGIRVRWMGGSCHGWTLRDAESMPHCSKPCLAGVSAVSEGCGSSEVSPRGRLIFEWKSGRGKHVLYRLRLFVGVGMTVAYHPLRRSVRALLTHTALYERVPFCNSFRVV